MTTPVPPRVRIVNRDHPHHGEYGWFTGELITLVTGHRMALVTLEQCRHGMDGCYVSAGDIRQVDEDDQYVMTWTPHARNQRAT